MDDYNTIKDWLLPKLEELQMTVEELALEIGVQPKTIYRYFTDERRPSPAVMGKICSFLEVPFEEGRSQYSNSRVGRPSGSKMKIKHKRTREIMTKSYRQRLFTALNAQAN